MMLLLRWSKAADELQHTYDTLTGDVLISAGVIAYLGAFTSGFRQDCAKIWTKLCQVKTQLRLIHEDPGNKSYRRIDLTVYCNVLFYSRRRFHLQMNSLSARPWGILLRSGRGTLQGCPPTASP